MGEEMNDGKVHTLYIELLIDELNDWLKEIKGGWESQIGCWLMDWWIEGI